MRFRYTFIAFILLLLVGTSAYYTLQKEQVPARPEMPLFPFTNEDLPNITKLVIQAKGEESVCEKQGNLGWWYFTNCDLGKVDDRRISRIFSELAQLRQTEAVVKDAADLAQFGLDKERTAVEVWFGGKPYKLILGSLNIEQQHYYACQGGTRNVILVPDTLFKEVNLGRIELADLRIFGVDTSEIEAAGFKEKGQEYQFSLQDNGFKMVKPLEKQLIPNQVFSVLALFRDLQQYKKSSLSIKPEDTSINEPELLLTLTIKGQPVELTMVSKDEKIYYGKRNTDNQIMEIRKSVINDIQRAIEKLGAQSEINTDTTQNAKNGLKE